MSSQEIVDALSQEGFSATHQGIAKFLRRYRDTGCLERAKGSGRPSKVSPAVKAPVEAQMRRDNETSAVQLCTLLSAHGHTLSLNSSPQQTLSRLDISRQCVLPDDQGCQQAEACGVDAKVRA